MKITYCKDGEVIADHKAEEYALTVLERDLRVANELVVHCARMLIKKGILPNNIDFEYEVNGVVILSQQANLDGKFYYWPLGFCDNFDNILDKLLS